MKVRSGFVSNSSSSSFVVIGYEFDTKKITTDKVDKIYAESHTDFVILSGEEEDGIKKDKIVVGCAVADMSDDGPNYIVGVTLQTIKSKAEKVKKKLIALGLEVKKEPKLYAGTGLG